MITINLTGPNRKISTHFAYFWAKWVTGFNDTQHCAKCLEGNWERTISTELVCPDSIELSSRDGEIFYMCGVAVPWCWRRNFHLVVRVDGKGKATKRASNGMWVEILGAKEIPFDGRVAKSLYPELGYKFQTCRNFQFAAQEFGRKPTTNPKQTFFQKSLFDT